MSIRSSAAFSWILCIAWACLWGCDGPTVPRASAILAEQGIVCDGSQPDACGFIQGSAAHLRCSTTTFTWTWIERCETCRSTPNDQGSFTFECLGASPRIVPKTICGDGACQPGETPNTCGVDCPLACGNGQCEEWENGTNCAVDCVHDCGDGLCSTGEACPSDCDAGAGCQRADDLVLFDALWGDEPKLATFRLAQDTCAIHSGCFGFPLPCVSRCLAKATGLTGTCSACLASYAACSAKPCAGPCAVSPTSDACRLCQVETCGEAFAACASGNGVPHHCGVRCPQGRVCDEESLTCVPAVCELPGEATTVQQIATLSLDLTNEGCDLDGDGKPNNVLGKMASLYKDLNATLAQSVHGGKTVVLLQAPEFQLVGPFDVAVLDGVLDQGAGTCDPATATTPCDVRATSASYDEASQQQGPCPVHTQLTTTVQDQALLANGDAVLGTAFPLGIVPGAIVHMPMHVIHAAGTVSGGAVWKSTQDGRLCGYVKKGDLLHAVDLADPAALKQIGDAATVKALLLGIFKPDLDLDDDGTKESISFSYRFTTVPARLVGVQKQE